MFRYLVVLLFSCLGQTAFSGNAARETGLKFGDYPTGKLNAITDVSGVTVGQVTLNSGTGKLVTGKGPVRTGVTVVIPNRDPWAHKPMASASSLNANGESGGVAWLKEGGVLETPIALTNTLSVPAVAKGLIEWTLKNHPEVDTLMPVVYECDDSSLNDIHGEHVKPEHVWQAIDHASNHFEEGSVGAGTGMIAFDFKAGIGSASRVVSLQTKRKSKNYNLGVLINLNIGTNTRNIFRISGILVNSEITDLKPIENPRLRKGNGSAVIIVATDAPMDPRQLQRLAARSFMGLARLGNVAYNGSGEFALAFSTGNLVPETTTAELQTFQTPSNSGMDNFFEAVVDATEEAAFNSMLAATTTTGRDGNAAYALPLARVREILRKHQFIGR